MWHICLQNSGEAVQDGAPSHGAHHRPTILLSSFLLWLLSSWSQDDCCPQLPLSVSKLSTWKRRGKNKEQKETLLESSTCILVFGSVLRDHFYLWERWGNRSLACVVLKEGPDGEEDTEGLGRKEIFLGGSPCKGIGGRYWSQEVMSILRWRQRYRVLKINFPYPK